MKKLLFFLILSLTAFSAMKAQQRISLQDAFKKAIASYPSLRSSRLNVSSHQALQGTAWDIGPTEFSSGAEEMGKGNDGIRTLIAIRQNLDIFNIGIRRQMLRGQTRVAEAENRLQERRIILEVGTDYICAYIARLKLATFHRLDSVYTDFEQAAQLRYTTGATSQLEYLSAQNQVRQVRIGLKQAEYDLLTANQNLSRWLSADTLYTPDDKMMLSEQERLLDLSSTTHPILGLAEEKATLADAGIKEARSAYLPKLFAEFSSQKIGSVNGYYSWQVGLSIPLVFGATKSKVRSAKIERERSLADYDDVRRRYSFSIKELQAELAKWEQSVTYYRQTALPMAQKQKEKALLTYKEQETNYLEFIQNMHDAVQIEMGYLDAYAKYLNTKLNLEYYQ